MNEKIDFVVTWVDGSDPIWKKEKEKYEIVNADNRNARYRDWDQLKYWFRAVEKYAPWVNKIHFVTYGHLPDWLDTKNPKLNIVNHQDFIPEKYRPVFNSTAIEVHLHRIPGISDQFVYFCDDMYLMKPCKSDDFFKKGKPVDMPKLEPVLEHHNEMYYYHLYNDYSIYRHYLIRKKLLPQIWKYINPKYGKIAVSNGVNLLARNVYFHPLHLPMPLLKTSMEKIWEQQPEILEKTAMSRMRQITDNSPELFRGYQLVTGNFCPGRINGIVLDTRNVEKVKKTIMNCPCSYMCLSDNSGDDDFELHKMQINEAFDVVFPQKSSFER